MTRHSIPFISAEEEESNVVGNHQGPPLAKLKSLPKADSTKLDPEWINIDELRLWIETCDEKHDACKHAAEVPGWPLWLIDVEKLCVVPAARGESRYMALSYVWGQVESSELTRENTDSLQKPGSLALENKGVRIPQTIRHAMGLVKLLACRYLWVDRFCICQDDTASKHTQISQMADIYANAYVTIVAANGWDANHGLRGIRGVTGPRQISDKVGRDYLEALQPFSTIWVRLFLASLGLRFPSSLGAGKLIAPSSVVAVFPRLDFPGAVLLPPQDLLPIPGGGVGMRTGALSRKRCG